MNTHSEVWQSIKWQKYIIIFRTTTNKSSKFNQILISFGAFIVFQGQVLLDFETTNNSEFCNLDKRLKYDSNKQNSIGFCAFNEN